MSTNDIEAVEHPVIGRKYRVECLHYTGSAWLRGMPAGFIPIIGPLHDDAEHIGFEPEHWHVDWRFMPKRAYDYNVRMVREPWMVLGRPVSSVNSQGSREAAPLELQRDEKGVAVVGRVALRMRREMPTWKVDQVHWMEKFKMAFVGVKLKCGDICPHRGIDLTSIPAINGVVTCPGHGLQFARAPRP